MTVAVVTSRPTAEPIAGLLVGEGVPAAVAADDAGGQEPELQLQGVRVVVPRPMRPGRSLLAAVGVDEQ